MALTVELGEGLTDADSFVSLVEVRAFATVRGVTLPTDDTELEVLVRKAHDYLLSTEHLLQGTRTVPEQSLPYPRTDVVLFGSELDANTIPETLKKAACQLVFEVNDGIDILPTSTGNAVVKEQVGPIKTEYAESSASNAPLANMPRVDAFLTPLRYSHKFRVIRV